MLKKVILAAVLLLFVPSLKAQLGIGAAGGILNPGLIESKSSASQFNTGWGYELFLHHNVVKIADTVQVRARWSYRQFINDIELPYILKTWFTFRYLSLNFFVDIKHSDVFALYGGLGVNLVSVRAQRDFFDYTETAFVPELNVGVNWILSQYYHVFSEISFQYGNLADVFDEDIPLTGFRVVIGAVMYLAEEN